MGFLIIFKYVTQLLFPSTNWTSVLAITNVGYQAVMKELSGTTAKKIKLASVICWSLRFLFIAYTQLLTKINTTLQNIYANLHKVLFHQPPHLNNHWTMNATEDIVAPILNQLTLPLTLYHQQ
jgi:hypothetical protein